MKWLSVVADALIGAGLIAEYICIRKAIVASRILKEQSDARLAEALNRAANAEIELAKFRAPRRALMTTAARATLTAALRPFAGVPFDTAFNGNDGEQADFVWDLEEVLVGAGWQQLPWGVPGVGTLTINRNRRPLAGSAAAQNVEIQLDPGWRPIGLPATQALVAVLNAIGVEAREAAYNTPNANVAAIHIVVGAKR